MLILVFLGTFVMIMLSLHYQFFVGYPLFAGLFFFSLLAVKRGVPTIHLAAFLRAGFQKSLLVIKIFVLIGFLTAAWMASGTVPAIVYYSLQLIHPSFFYVIAFLISCLVSFLIGTSLGTASTLGVALMMLARSGQAHIPLAAGALIAGAYFGDRFSPMSSSANLVANITATNLFDNLRSMARSMVVPLVASVVLYLLFSLRYPLQLAGAEIDRYIAASFRIQPLVLLPAFVMLLLSAMKVGVKRSMTLSMITAFLLAVLYQHSTPIETFGYLLKGFALPVDDPLYAIIKGGGLLSMARPAFIVMTSCALAEVIHGAHFLDAIVHLLTRAASRFQLFLYTLVVSLVTGAFGGTQAVSVIMTAHVMDDAYHSVPGVSQGDLAVDIEDTAIVLSALIPWNIASLLPTTLLGVDRLSFIPFAFFLYLLPLWNLVSYRTKNSATCVIHKNSHS